MGNCSQGTYTIATNLSHTPTWSGQLVVDASGNATFTLDGSTTGRSVNAQCGTDPSKGAWIMFTDTSVTPAVHYQKAYWNGTDYSGAAENNDHIAGDEDTWTATPNTAPGGTGHRHGY